MTKMVLMAVAVAAIAGCGGDREWGEFYEENGVLNQTPCPTEDDAETSPLDVCVGHSSDAASMVGADAESYDCWEVAQGAVMVDGVSGCCVPWNVDGQTVRFWYECEAE